MPFAVISIRVSMEALYVVNKILASETPEVFVLDGRNPAMVRAALKVRINIVEWYRRFLTREVKELGFYTANGRLWQRGDLLALEMVRKGSDVSESGPARERKMLEYLDEMSRRGSWGSTPEVQAAACMTKRTIHTWQRMSGKLCKINSAHGTCDPLTEDGQYNLIFSESGNHYDALIPAEHYNLLKKTYGPSKVAHMIPVY